MTTHTKQPLLAETMSDSGNRVVISKKKKQKLFFILVASFLLLVSTIIINGIVNIDSPAHQHQLIPKTSCSITPYPDLCFSAIASVPDASTHNLSTLKDVLTISLNLTLKAVHQNYLRINKLIIMSKRIKGFTIAEREKAALYDCLELMDITLDELRKAYNYLIQAYPDNKSITDQHAQDLTTLISAAMTNQDTCIDGFSNDGDARKALLGGHLHVFRMCSNALAMIKNMTDIITWSERTISLVGDDGSSSSGSGFPSWLSDEDRMLLLSSSVTPNVTVAADGSGDYTTVSAAVEAAPVKSKSRYIIAIKAGVYSENVDVPSNKHNLMFLGDGNNATIITGNRSFGGGDTTFNSCTVAAVGEGFLARGVTFQNTAGPYMYQAVALRVESDKSAFYECEMLAFQDTLYVHSNRQFYVNCLIVGTIDFIFGNAAAVFQDCDIHPRVPITGQQNTVTAQGRTEPNQNTGIVIQKCRIAATSDLQSVQDEFQSYLGRPWKNYSRTIVMQTEISDVINPAGWLEWNGEAAPDTLYYAEYNNTGDGAGTEHRVTWEGFRVLTNDTEAEPFTVENFIQGDIWLNSTGFPYSLGL